MSSDDQGPVKAIRGEGLGKCYRMYAKPADRLKEMLLHRFGRAYGHDFWALRNVSFDVAPGESLGIIGRNGSGKSTLLQLIAGTLQPTTGCVEVQGRVGALLELGSGFNPDFTGRENVFMNGAILGLSREEMEEKFEAITAFAELGEFIDQPVKTYSSGMFVRLAFAVVAHIEADILIVDEALAVGDVFFVQKCMRFLRAFQERGVLLFVTHDTAAVNNLCERALWLDHGEQKMLGPAKEVTEAYLEAFYAKKQGAAFSRHDASEPRKPSARKPVYDQRLEYVNRSPYRNDIRLVPFNPEGKRFGDGQAKLEEVVLTDAQDRPLSWVVGGETVKLRLSAQTSIPLEQPILGFYFKDRLGQALFGDNTCLTTLEHPVALEVGDRLTATFTFQMPILQHGDYSITVSIASGTQDDHVQHQWIHDALALKSVSTSVCTGLMGVPMLNIELIRTPAPGAGPKT